MKKFVASILLVICTPIVALGLSVNDSQASTWHKGTPKALRGFYSYEQLHNAYGTVPIIQLKKSSYLIAELYPYRNTINVTSIHYKKVGKYYRLVGKAYLSEQILHQTYKVDQVFYKSGKNLKNTSYSSFKKQRFSNYKGNIATLIP